MILAIGLLSIGFIFLLKGADWLVDGSCAIAKRHLEEATRRLRAV